MSIFSTHDVACPACGAQVPFELVVSVSADRRPDLRAAILDGSFQSQPCPACGKRFRVEPEFSYIDIAHGQFVGVWPVTRRADWQACAERTRTTFDRAFGKDAGPEAQPIGRRMQPRVVFGWPALIEKILARQAGIDDRDLELAKLVALRSVDDAPLPGRQELRLLAVEPEALVLGWVRTAEHQVSSALRLPRSVLAEIAADPAAWREARDSVADGLVVDFQREMLAA